MQPSDLLTISAFSKLSGVNRKTLIYYDRLGLFQPAHVAANGYRYYHRSQLDTIGVIHLFKELGMSLGEIRAYLDQREPEVTLKLLRKQEEHVRQQLMKLELARQMIVRRADNIEASMKIDTRHMHVVWQARTPVLRGCAVQASKQQFPEELWQDFQQRLQREHAPLGYPNGVIIPREAMLRGDGDAISGMYCRMTTAQHEQTYMPEGYYLVAYARGDYGDTERIFPQIFETVAREGYIIIGDAYEEYLLDEVVLQQPDDYLVQIMVQIEEPGRINRTNPK